MLFLTFQPIGYEVMKRNPEWHDAYHKTIKFDPMYCICAETLLSTVVGTVTACPTIPEQAIFFKSSDY